MFMFFKSSGNRKCLSELDFLLSSAPICTESTITPFSTHSLRAKAAQLDAMDGGNTTVEWCPPYLVIERSEVLTLKEVAQADDAGMACYQEIPGLHEFMAGKKLTDEVDPQNHQLLRAHFDQPHIAVFGPNNHHESGKLVAIE